MDVDPDPGEGAAGGHGLGGAALSLLFVMSSSGEFGIIPLSSVLVLVSVSDFSQDFNGNSGNRHFYKFCQI